METKATKTNSAKKTLKKPVAKKTSTEKADLKAVVYNTSGKEAGTIALPAKVFGVQWNADLVQQVVVSMQSNARQPIAHAKDRSEVSGGGKKPWRQKGTGRARHGSSRSPIWVGGGVTHGPKNLRNFAKQINKKMKMKALFSALSKKVAAGEVVFIDTLSITEPKTAAAKKAVEAFSAVRKAEGLTNKKANAFFVAMPSPSDTVKKSFRNLGNVEVEDVRNLNVVDVLRYNTVVFVSPEESVAILEAKQA